MRKFLGAPYPIEKNPNGFLYSQSGINQIKADMLILLLTNPGERVMNPAYGTPLKKLIFEPNDEVLKQKARNIIFNSISRWEPRVVINQVEVLTNIENSSLNSNDDLTEKSHILFVRILFIDPQNIQQVQELALEIPLAGTGA
jgi:phage baseplate assembly protein W